jgi:GMP synthase (glutamine-hydrolysing)
LRLLVLEGNTAAGRRRIAETAGATPAESYAAVLRSLAQHAVVDICTPADADAMLPEPLNDDFRRTERKNWIASLDQT